MWICQSFGRDDPALKLQDSAAVSIFVVGAIVLVMGSGYTKYAEAIETLRSVQAEELQQREPVGLVAGSRPGLTAILLVLAVLSQVFTRSRRSQGAAR